MSIADKLFIAGIAFQIIYMIQWHGQLTAGLPITGWWMPIVSGILISISLFNSLFI